MFCVIYLDQRRYDDAERLFTNMTHVSYSQPTKPAVQHPYKLIGECGLAIVAAIRDDVENSKKLFDTNPIAFSVFSHWKLPLAIT